MDSERDWVSLREFARRMQVAPNAVSQALENGRIVRRPEDKKIHWPSQSDAWWGLRDMGKARSESGGGEPADEDGDEADEALEESEWSRLPKEFQRAKVRKEVAAAGLKELELKIALGQVVQASHVRSAMTQFAVDVREAVLTIPDRSASEVAAAVAAVCPGLGIDLAQEIIGRVLRRESRQVLETISRVVDKC